MAANMDVQWPQLPGTVDLTVLEPSRLGQINRGNHALAEAGVSDWKVLPVSADGECFFRSVSVELCSDVAVADCRIAYILAIETLMEQKSSMCGFISQEEQDTRLACVQGVSFYAESNLELDAFDVYCLDKLEGLRRGDVGLDTRHWADEPEIIALMQKLEACVLVAEVGQRSMFLRASSWEYVQSLAQTVVEADFFLVHWSGDFAHYDAVYNCGSRSAWKVPARVTNRFQTLMQKSLLCQAYIEGDMDKLRQSAVSLLAPKSVVRSLRHAPRDLVVSVDVEDMTSVLQNLGVALHKEKAQQSNEPGDKSTSHSQLSISGSVLQWLGSGIDRDAASETIETKAVVAGKAVVDVASASNVSQAYPLHGGTRATSGAQQLRPRWKKGALQGLSAESCAIANSELWQDSLGTCATKQSCGTSPIDQERHPSGEVPLLAPEGGTAKLKELQRRGAYHNLIFKGWLKDGVVECTEMPRDPRTMIYWSTQDGSRMYGISAIDLQKELHWRVLTDCKGLQAMMREMHCTLAYQGFLSGRDQRRVRVLPPPYAEKTKLVFAPTERSSAGSRDLIISYKAFRHMHSIFAKTWRFRCEPVFLCDGSEFCMDMLPLVRFGWCQPPPREVVLRAKMWEAGCEVTSVQLDYLQRAIEVASSSLRHIWFMPPSPKDMKQSDGTQNFAVFYDEITRSCRELSFEDIRLNNIVPMEPKWTELTELVARLPFPVKIDHRRTEEVFPERFVLQFVDKKGRVLERVAVLVHALRRSIELRRLAGALTKDAKRSELHKSGVVHVGRLCLEAGQAQLGKNIWDAFQGKISWAAVYEQVGSDFFSKLCDAPINQTDPTSWLVETGVTLLASEESMRKTFIRRKTATLRGQPPDALVWNLEDFRQKAAAHGLEYLGCPRVVRSLPLNVPGLQEWLGHFSPPLHLQALMTTEWEETHVPCSSPLTSQVWWRLPGCQPFPLSLCELGHGAEVVANNLHQKSIESHNLNSFVTFGALFKLAYLGPAVKADSGEGTVKYVMDEHATPDQPSRWPPAQRPTYWRHESGNLLFLSIVDILERSDEAFTMSVDQFDKLGKQVGWMFIGASGKTVQGEMLQATQCDDLSSDLKGLHGARDMPTDARACVFWCEPPDIIRVRSYQNVMLSRHSLMPSLRTVGALLEAEDLVNDDGELFDDSVVRTFFADKVPDEFLSYLIRNATVQVYIRRHCRYQNRVDARVAWQVASADDSDEDMMPAPDASVVEQRLHCSLRGHVVPPVLQKSPGALHGSKEQKLKHYNPVFAQLADYGLSCLEDELWMSLEAHLMQETPDSRCERVCLPAELMEVFRAPEDLLGQSQKQKLEEWIAKAASRSRANCTELLKQAATAKPVAGLRILLRAVALLQLQEMCTAWEAEHAVNHSVYDIRRLSLLQYEEMKQALRPLHSGMCALCGRLLGVNIGSDVCVGTPMRRKRQPCSVFAQPPFLLLWSRQKLASFCPEVFMCGDEQELRLCGQWASRPPWVRSGGDEQQWTYCTDCFSWVTGKVSRRVPMRNAYELLRTRLYTDKLRADLYAQLSEHVEGLPAIPGLSQEQQRLVFRKQLMHYLAIRKAAGDDISQFFGAGDMFESAEEFWLALYAEMGLVRRTNAASVLGFVERSDDAALLKDVIQKLAETFEVTEYVPEGCLCTDEQDEEYWCNNLVPEEWPCLHQHAPNDVPFEKLLSQEAKAVVSVCRLWSHLRAHRAVGKPSSKTSRQVPTFTHVSGNMQTKAKFPHEDMGFFGIVAISDEEREKHFKLRACEWDSMLACQNWLQEHNIFVRMYKTSLESLYEGTKVLQSQQREAVVSQSSEIVPYADSSEVRTHDDKRVARQLGPTDAALLTVDLSEYKGAYHKLASMMEATGESVARDAARLDQLVSVSFRDCNFDAKAFTALHPWASGSFNSIPDCVPYNAFVQARMHSVDPCFRDDTLWIFAQEDRKIKLQLHAQAAQQEESSAASKAVLDKTKKFSRQWGKRCSSQVAEKGTKRQRAYYDMTFGTDMPKQIVSSDAYFRQGRQNLLTLTRQDQDGYVHCMFTYVSNFAHGEILAYRHRGPFARARPEEHLSYLLESRSFGKKTDHKFPATVVFSYQRRRHHFQERVLRTGVYDALGGQFARRMRRTEEQQSRNPHDHYVCHYEKCTPQCSRTSRFCLRNTDHKLPRHISEARDDQVHKHYHAAEIRAELVRFPSAGVLDLDVIVAAMEVDSSLAMDGECCVLDMLVGFLQRRVQTHFMLHRHSLSYCMAKGKCRFGAPWKQCHEQHHDSSELSCFRKSEC